MTVANNGKLALSQNSEHSRFDAVLMDLHMPEMDGLRPLDRYASVLNWRTCRYLH